MESEKRITKKGIQHTTIECETPDSYVKTEIAAEYFFQFTSVYIRIRHKAHINSFTYQGLIDYTHQQTNQTHSQHYQS